MNRHKGRFLWWRNLSACLLLCSSSSVFAASADVYEPGDNTFNAEATCIDTNGTKQSHTIHTIDDEDWICFKAQPQWTYKIVLDNVGNDIDVVLEVYDTDGSTRLERKNRGFDGEKEEVDFTPSKEGTYYVKVTHTGFFIDDTQYNIHITKIAPALTLLVEPTEVIVQEGGQGEFTIKLSEQPENDVKIEIEADPTINDSDITTSTTNLTLTAENNYEQTVTLNAAKDDDAVAGQTIFFCKGCQC